ncbi:MAG: YidH family protein [Phenylobacterium sp.]
MARTVLKKPAGWAREPVPPIPVVDESNADAASVAYSHYRTGLSNHRTDLSEHRTELSEYRTGLSDERTDMSKRRTGMSFQRTRLSADRTLMSVIRTSLSLISFGFTIYQVFEKLQTSHVFESGEAPRNFGMALILLGLVMLIVGIVYHVQFMLALRGERRRMVQEDLLYGESPFPPSMTLITALLLLALGLTAVVSIALKVGPFS